MASRANFMIPELKLASNDAQLRRLQHQMLHEHYEKQIYEQNQKLGQNSKIKRSQSTVLNPLNPKLGLTVDVNPEWNYTNNKSGYMMYNEPDVEWKHKIAKQQQIRQELINNYEEQLSRKNKQKIENRQKQRIQEQQKYDVVRMHVQKDQNRSLLAANEYRRQAAQQIRLKEMQKSQQKARLQQQKRIYQQRYANNLSNIKQRSFLEHFTNVEGSLDANSKAYLTSVAPMNKEIQKRKQKMISQGIKESDSKMRQNLANEYQRAAKYRNQLRDSLVLQIKEKQENKRKSLANERSQGYTSAYYQNVHHPINNPVDFKMTHDNRYIIGQLQSKLARSGSHSII